MQLRAAREERGAQVIVTPAVAVVPLAAGDDLERARPPLVELHRMGDRLRLADQLSGLAEQLDDPLLRLLHGLAREVGVASARRTVDVAPPFGVRRDDAAVAPDDVAQRQLELAPPHDVGGVTEGADHRDARSLVRVGEVVRDDGHRHAEERGAHRVAEPVRVAGVVRVRDQRDARGEELGPGGLDHQVRLPVGAVERERVVRAGQLAVLELGLSDRGAVVDVPERGRLRRVRLAARQHAQECALRRPARHLADRRVRQLPVDREPEPAPELLELLLVLDHEPVAQLDEPLPRDRDLAVARLLRRGEVGLHR